MLCKKCGQQKGGPAPIPDIIPSFGIGPQMVLYVVQQGNHPAMSLWEVLMSVAHVEVFYAFAMS